MPDFVGYYPVEITDAELELTFPVAVLYPTTTPPQVEQVGPYVLDVARQAPLAPGRFPLVIISHGTGGSGLVYRTLAVFLAAQGYVVALPEHPRNNRNDNSWANTKENLVARPRHLQLTLDALLTYPHFAAGLQPNSVALIGHSLGGYTALALAGGAPAALTHEVPAGQPRHIPVPTPDSRVKALVLLAPATPWFREAGSLTGVQVPILLLTAEKDAHTEPWHGLIVRQGVADPALVTHREVPNAGHYSFLSPFPPERVSPNFPPSQDPPGFDREQFQLELQQEIIAFLRQHC